MRSTWLVTCSVLVALVLATTRAAAQIPRDEPSRRALVDRAAHNVLRAVLPGLDSRALGDDAFEIFLSEDEHDALARAGVDVTTKERAQPLKAVLPAGYPTLAGINEFLAETQSAFPGIARVLDSTAFGAGRTHEGRALPLVKISGNVTADEDEPAVLISSNIHAREIVTPVIAVEIIRRLTTRYATDASIRQLVDSNQIYIVPVVNPDGYEYVWNVNNMWRKNRKPNTGGSYGVDCNRNFDLGWSSTCSGSSVPSSETYKGTAPESEEETQIIVDLSMRYNLAKLVQFHSSGREVIHSYVCTPITKALDDYIIAEAKTLAAAASYATRRPTDDGQHQEWTIRNLTAYSFLVETETEFQPSYADALAEFERVWPLTVAFLGRVTPIKGTVKCGGVPVRAKVTVREFGADITSTSDSAFGSFRMFVPAGTWTLVIAGAPCQGSTTTQRTVAVRDGATTNVLVDLQAA